MIAMKQIFQVCVYIKRLWTVYIVDRVQGKQITMFTFSQSCYTLRVLWRHATERQNKSTSSRRYLSSIIGFTERFPSTGTIFESGQSKRNHGSSRPSATREPDSFEDVAGNADEDIDVDNISGIEELDDHDSVHKTHVPVCNIGCQTCDYSYNADNYHVKRHRISVVQERSFWD